MNHSKNDLEDGPFQLGDSPPRRGSGAPNSAGARGAGGLFDQLYGELHSIAAKYFSEERAGHTLQPTALVHEAYVRLAELSSEWSDPVHFRALAARVMRHVLINHALARNAEKRGGGRRLITLQADPSDTEAPELDIEGLDRALTRLAELDQRKARVVELRFFGGLKADEAACELEVSLSTVEADWRMAKAWLRSELSRE